MSPVPTNTRLALGSTLGLALGLSVLWLGACGRPAAARREAPRWQRLALGFAPTDREQRFECRLRRAEWTRRGARVWSAPRELATTPPAQGRLAPTLAGGARGFVYLSLEEVDERFLGMPVRGLLDPQVEQAITRDIADPAFTLAGGLVYLVLPEDSEPPDTATLAEVQSLGEERAGAWRVLAPDLAADGLPVLPGEAVEVSFDGAEGCTLHFTTVALGGNLAGGDPRRARFRVSTGGRLLLEHEQAVGPDAAPVSHALPLPDGASTLRFEVAGPPCLAAFLTPVVGPREVGAPGARPWPAPPDIVLVVADTYRADNLGAWGGDARIAPFLNSLAEDSRRFLEVRTPATWTLPAHASMFTGLHAKELGIQLSATRLPAAAVTLAEHLGDRGYRTVATTGGGYVSREHGLAQGFEWFREEPLGIPNGVHGRASQHSAAIERIVAGSLERSAADDGRPLFLFVHTYRTHDPYYVTEETRARLGELTSDDDCIELKRQLRACRDQQRRGTPFAGEPRELCRRLEGLYRGASADLDRRARELVEGLRAQGRIEGAVLAFTSDHGESFGEHGVVGHSTGVWGEQARVPLLLRAPGLAVGDDRRPTSLLALPRTLCTLAGVAPAPSWRGDDLSRDGAGVPVVVYQLGLKPSDVALTDGARKVVLRDGLPDRSPLVGAYDLGADPGEREDVRGERWAAELAQRWRPELRAIEDARFASEQAELDAGAVGELRALGY